MPTTSPHGQEKLVSASGGLTRSVGHQCAVTPSAGSTSWAQSVSTGLRMREAASKMGGDRRWKPGERLAHLVQLALFGDTNSARASHGVFEFRLAA
jgi:hypothetical protein